MYIGIYLSIYLLDKVLRKNETDAENLYQCFKTLLLFFFHWQYMKDAALLRLFGIWEKSQLTLNSILNTYLFPLQVYLRDIFTHLTLRVSISVLNLHLISPPLLFFSLYNGLYLYRFNFRAVRYNLHAKTPYHVFF